MNNKTMYILIALGVGLIIWYLYSWLSVRNIEEPKYSVVSVADGYEIREYNSYILAETVISGAKDRNDAARKGFPIVAGYIFGDNTKKDKIAMTVPVNTEETTSEKIAMTVPVNTEKIAMTVPVNTEEAEKGSYKVSFVLPSEYTMDTLPTPNNSRVSLVQVPSRKVAVRRFTWTADETRLRKNEEILLSSLKRDGVVPVGAVNVARFNPPWTIPFMLRNEVQVNVK
jgi:xanthosine utilization system XapX-like protein